MAENKPQRFHLVPELCKDLEGAENVRLLFSTDLVILYKDRFENEESFTCHDALSFSYTELVVPDLPSVSVVENSPLTARLEKDRYLHHVIVFPRLCRIDVVCESLSVGG